VSKSETQQQTPEEGSESERAAMSADQGKGIEIHKGKNLN